MPKALENPADLAAREALLEASFLAGTAFTKTYIGYMYAFAHTIGGKYGVPHRLANAVLLPHVMEYSLPNCLSEFAELAHVVGLDTASCSTEELAQKFIGSIKELSKASKIPTHLDAFPASGIDEVITAAFKECHGVYPVPRYYTHDAAFSMLKSICKEG